MNPSDSSPDPEQNTSQSELSQMLEEAILALPRDYRAVIMLRDVEELSTAETATALGISEQNVKVRLFRGRAMVRRSLFERVGGSSAKAFPFMGVRCDRVVGRVFKTLAEQNEQNS